MYAGHVANIVKRRVGNLTWQKVFLPRKWKKTGNYRQKLAKTPAKTYSKLIVNINISKFVTRDPVRRKNSKIVEYHIKLLMLTTSTKQPLL